MQEEMPALQPWFHLTILMCLCSALRSRLSFPQQCIWSVEPRPEQGISISHMFSGMVQSRADVFLGYMLALLWLRKCLFWVRKTVWRSDTWNSESYSKRLVLSRKLFTRLQEFTCFMYSSNPGTSDVNDLWYCLFCTKKGDLDSNQLPLCVDTLCKHCDQANYPAGLWGRSLQSCPQIPSPVGHGWSLEEGRLIVNWMSGEPVPMAVLLLLSCQCKRRCQLPNCIFLSNGLQCTDLRSLCQSPWEPDGGYCPDWRRDCANRHDDPTEAIAKTDDDDD